MRGSWKKKGEDRGKPIFSVTKDAQWFVFFFYGVDRSGIRPLDPQIVRLQLERGELIALARETRSFILKNYPTLSKILLFTRYFEIELLKFLNFKLLNELLQGLLSSLKLFSYIVYKASIKLSND